MSPIVVSPTYGPGPNSSLQIGRLLLGPPITWGEQTGDPLSSIGGATVPGQRTAPQFQVTLATWAADGQTDTLAARLKLRRYLRALLNNSDLKYQGYLYVIYSDDPEQNGWYAPDQGPLTDLFTSSGLATGLWQIQQPWNKIGAQRTHREAKRVWMLDLRTGSYERDTLGWLISTDFSALPALQLTVLPNGATQARETVANLLVSGPTLPAGRDGGACQILQGLADTTDVSYERPETALNLSDVIVYDRRGQITAPATGPDTSWEEVPGPDYQWNWLTSGQPVDAPVLDNGLVRVRYDSTNTPGFRVDLWNGAAYVEQGKMNIFRSSTLASTYDDTWVAASLVEWTPDRAVMQVILSSSQDAYSSEKVFITMQRGELGVTFEAYPALQSNGQQADAQLRWTPALNSGVPDLNESVIKIDSQGSGNWIPGLEGTAIIAATAGTGAGAGNSGLFPAGPTALGNTNFTSSENWVALLRYPTAYNAMAPYQTTFVVLQGTNARFAYATDSAAYGTTTDQSRVIGQLAGYIQAQVQFAAAAGDQVQEAEAIRNTGSGTTSQVADAGASGGQAVKDTQTSFVANTLVKASTNFLQASYRLFARVKVDSGATGEFGWALGSNASSGITTTSTSWTWVDVGEVTATAAGQQFSFAAWRSAGASGAVYVDRIEAVLIQDRVRTNAIYSGSRDQAFAALYDSRVLGAVVAR